METSLERRPAGWPSDKPVWTLSVFFWENRDTTGTVTNSRFPGEESPGDDTTLMSVMSSLARVAAVDCPDHVTQRGNYRQQTFFGEEDYRLYLELLSDYSRPYSLEVWLYCLMPNHVHVIAVPRESTSLAYAGSAGSGERVFTASEYSALRAAIFKTSGSFDPMNSGKGAGSWPRAPASSSR